MVGSANPSLATAWGGIPAAMGQSLSAVSLLIKRGDRVAVGVGSRGIANISGEA